MFYDDDADLGLLDGKTVAILGYGSQGHAHARNLKDSGVDVIVGLREGSKSVEHAEAAGLRVESIADAASHGVVVVVLLPDEKHHDVYEQDIKDGIAPGNLLMFGHGFSIHYGEVDAPPEVDVALVAPKGPGHLVRRQYLEGSGVPCLVAVQQDASGTALQTALAYAKGIGGTRGKRIISDETRQAMKAVLGEIQDGTFAREWIAENRAGQENFQRMRAEQQGHKIEVEGRELRKMMDWIDTEFEEG